MFVEGRQSSRWQWQTSDGVPGSAHLSPVPVAGSRAGLAAEPYCRKAQEGYKHGEQKHLVMVLVLCSYSEQ